MRIVAALMLIPILVVVFYEGRKAYWDHQVQALCANDGGVSITERVYISSTQESLLPHVGGAVAVAPESLSDVAWPAFSRTTEAYIHEGQPTVVRYEHEVIRRLDSRSVAKAIVYVRSGGDIPSPAFPSSNYCPPLDRINFDISKVFEVRNDLSQQQLPGMLKSPAPQPTSPPDAPQAARR